MTIVTINPATGDRLETYEAHSPAAVETRLAAAEAAQRVWRHEEPERRGALLARLAGVLRERTPRYARLITLEMGKPLAEAAAEIEKCAVTCDYYARNAERFLAPEPVETSARDSMVAFEPLGTVLGIMPWNYPFWQTIRFLAPALLGGNAAILKHANNVPGCALALQAALDEAGSPAGLFAALLIENGEVRAVVEDARVSAVSLTGSTEVGALVAAQAGSRLKPLVLELGGSDPFIVLADADLELAVATAVKARYSNNGQSCISAKRFLVAEEIADAFTEAFTASVRALAVGDPLDPATKLGPLARDSLRSNLHRQVGATRDAGARLLCGGEPLAGPGWFYAPTVLEGVAPGMAAFDEETFGPAAAITRVADAAAAVALANASPFGLGASLWTRDLDHARRLIPRIEAGAVFVNALVASDARIPFGGIKQSGYGRELGVLGLRSFVNQKTIWIGA